MKNITLTLIVFSCFILNCFAQRGEVDKVKIASGGNLINLYKSGVAINKNSIDPQKEIVIYDANLKKTGTVRYSLDGKKENIKTLCYDSTLNKILVFHGVDEVRNLTIIDPETKKVQTLKIKAPSKQRMLGDVIFSLNKTSFILSHIYNEDININTIDTKTGEITKVELPEEWKKRTIQRVIKANSKYLAICYKDKKIVNMALMDDEGNIVEDKILTNNENDFVIDPYLITDIGNDEFAIVGNYRSEISSRFILGMFVAKIGRTQLKYIKYIEFNKISNFYNYLPDKKKDKVERQKSVNYVTLYHHVINMNGSLVVSAEFFYPTYKTFNNSNGDPAFNGYQYTHAVVLGFNVSGEKEFEHCIPIHLGYKALRVNQKLARYMVDGAVKLGYFSSDKVYSFSLKDGKIEPDNSRQEVLAETEKEDKDNIPLCWYNNYYYQTMYNEQESAVYLIKFGIE